MIETISGDPNATSQTRDMIVGRVVNSKQFKASQSKSKQVKASQSKSKQVKASQSKSKQVSQSKSKQVKASQSKPKQVKASQSKSKQVKASQSKSKQVKASQSKSKQVKASQSKSSSSSTSGNHGNLLAKKRMRSKVSQPKIFGGQIKWEGKLFSPKANRNKYLGWRMTLQTRAKPNNKEAKVMRVVKSEEKLKGKFWGEKNLKQSRMSDSKSKGGKSRNGTMICRREEKKHEEIFWKGEKRKRGNILKEEKGKKEKKRKWI